MLTFLAWARIVAAGSTARDEATYTSRHIGFSPVDALQVREARGFETCHYGEHINCGLPDS